MDGNRQQQNLTKRARWFEGTEIAVPTLAHVPGVVVEGRYSTKVLRMRGRQAILTPHGALKRPREITGSTQIARLVHLGGGKVMMR